MFLKLSTLMYMQGEKTECSAFYMATPLEFQSYLIKIFAQNVIKIIYFYETIMNTKIMS